MEQTVQLFSDYNFWLVVVGTIIGGLILIIITRLFIKMRNILIPFLQSKVWSPLYEGCNRVWNLLCSVFWATYSFLGAPVIDRGVKKYMHELSDHIWMQEMPLKNDEDACLIPFDTKNNREAYKEILKVNFIAAGKGMAYIDILNYMFEPGTAPPKPVRYHDRRTEANCYKWETDDVSMREMLILVEDEAEKDSLLNQRPPVDESPGRCSSTETQDPSCTE